MMPFGRSGGCHDTSNSDVDKYAAFRPNGIPGTNEEENEREIKSSVTTKTRFLRLYYSFCHYTTHFPKITKT